MIARYRWMTTNLIFSKPAVKKLGFLTLRKGLDKEDAGGCVTLLDRYLQVNSDVLGCRCDLYTIIIHLPQFEEEEI